MPAGKGNGPGIARAVAVAAGFEPAVACTTQHFECCTFGRSDTLPPSILSARFRATQTGEGVGPHTVRPRTVRPDAVRQVRRVTRSAVALTYPRGVSGGHTLEDFFPGGVPGQRLRIKNVPPPPATALVPEPVDLDAALAPVVGALAGRRLAVITGAGISTDSGIPDYRSPGSAPRTPITVQQFMSNERWRQHYWARNHVGWRYPARAVPNAGHLALAELEQAGVVAGVITQNIDLLHVRAGSRHVVHLHGRYDTVRCTACGGVSPIARLHERLEVLNPGWVDRHVDDAEVAPDADAALAATTGFVVAGCEHCGGVLRTDVVFFGDSVPPERVEAARDLVDSAGAVLVAGSSLAVRSALRWVRRAHADGKPVVLINRGPTRADDIAALKVEASTSRALPWLAERLPSA